MTSAVLRAGRVVLPEKITSSMSTARMALCEDSPITQRSASTRLDFPQPFGPTTPVSPGSIITSVGSTKDLKPIRRRRDSFMQAPTTNRQRGNGVPRSKHACHLEQTEPPENNETAIRSGQLGYPVFPRRTG